MEFWIILVMKYKDILSDINSIKSQRFDFINKFEKHYDFVYDSLIEATENNILNSIRVHKFLTNNNKLGKVNTARFLNNIELNENTKISQLKEEEIIKIAKYSSEQ